MPLEKVLETISRVLNVPVNMLSEDSSSESFEQWNSLKHMNLVLTLEEEFGVTFPDEDIVEMLSVRKIVEVLVKLKAAR